jgi:uncharacterized protein YndB with AHSA1/START domain
VIRLDEAVDVRRDAAATFEFLSAIERYPDWLPGVIAAEQTSDGPLAAGTTFRLRIAGPAGPIDAAGEVTEAAAPRRLAISAEAPPGVVRGGFELEDIDVGTRLRVWMELELRGAYRFAEGLAARQLKASLPVELDRLRTRLEAATAL